MNHAALVCIKSGANNADFNAYQCCIFPITPGDLYIYNNVIDELISGGLIDTSSDDDVEISSVLRKHHLLPSDSESSSPTSLSINDL